MFGIIKVNYTANLGVFLYMTEIIKLDEDPISKDWKTVFQTETASTKKEKIEAARSFFATIKKRVDKTTALRVTEEEVGHMLADTNTEGGSLGIMEDPKNQSRFRPFYHVKGLRTVYEAKKILSAKPELMSKWDLVDLDRLQKE